MSSYKKVVVVAGGTGFIGRHVVQELISKGFKVVVVSRGVQTPPRGSAFHHLHGIVCDGDSSGTSGISENDYKYVQWDLAGPLRPDVALRDACENAVAFINLVGIKREDARHGQTFQSVHVDTTKYLLRIANDVSKGKAHFVLLSAVCARPDPSSLYHNTKHQAEKLVEESGLSYTIVRAGVVYGKNDNMITSLVSNIRQVGIFPGPDFGKAELQPISVHDLTTAITTIITITRPPHENGTPSAPSSPVVGRVVECVGKDTHTVKQLVQTAASGCGLPVIWLPVPSPLLYAAASFADYLYCVLPIPEPPLPSASQVKMLTEGMVGNPNFMVHELGVEVERFSADTVRDLEQSILPILPVSFRLFSTREDYVWAESFGVHAKQSAQFAVMCAVLLTFITFVVHNIWYSMLIFNMIMAPVALMMFPFLKQAIRPTANLALVGATSSIVLYGVGWVGYGALCMLFPGFVEQKEILYHILWSGLLPYHLSFLVLSMIVVPAEEIIWRGAILLPFVGYSCSVFRKTAKDKLDGGRHPFGIVVGIAASSMCFLVAHLAVGPPLLWVACFVMGSIWSAVALKGKSLVGVYFCHLCWDVMVMFLFPY